MISGLIYLKSPNETRNNTETNETERVHPKWDKKKQLRVCLQYWDEAARKKVLNEENGEADPGLPKEPEGPGDSQNSEKASANDTKQIQDFSVQQLRWILNFTFPMKFANWTPQFAV